MPSLGETAGSSFATRLRHLAEKFAAAAAVDSDVYLPNFTPTGPVDAVLIGMEPSLGRWARPPDQAAPKIAAGFRNFMWSPEDFILHYAARRFLCSHGGSYHVTDISKGAMTVGKAHIDRRARYARWVPLLRDEIRIIAKPDAQIIAIGQDVYNVLEQSDLGREVKMVMHYSPLAGAARNAAVKGREAAFLAFTKMFSMQDIIDVAAQIMEENSISATMTAETIARLNRATLSESRKKLAFIYSSAFAKLRAA